MISSYSRCYVARLALIAADDSKLMRAEDDKANANDTILNKAFTYCVNANEDNNDGYEFR